MGSYYFSTREGTEPAPWLTAAMLAEQRDSLHPADYARFWECRWVEPKGSWITREMYDAAEVGQEAIAGDVTHKAVGFVDIGLVRDATAVAVAHMEDGRVVADTLKTLQGSRNEPVELEVLEELVVELTLRYHVARWIFEAPQAVASVQRLQKTLGTSRVTARYPTAETQAKLFGSLYMLFSNRRLVLFPHERLRQEALSLVIKTSGGRMRVVESTAVHQDHVIALGGAAEMLLSGQASTVDGSRLVGAISGANGDLSRASLWRPELAHGSEYLSPASSQGSKWRGAG